MNFVAFCSVFQQQAEGDEHCDEVSKKCFLIERKIAAQMNESIHKRKEKCRRYDVKYAFIFAFHEIKQSLIINI